MRFNFHLPYSNFRLPLENCMFYNISFKTKWNMVLACESIFSRTSLDGRPRNLHTLSKVNLEYTKCTFPVGQARCSFHLPHSYNLQILLARGNGASTNVEPCLLSKVHRRTRQFLVQRNFRHQNVLKCWLLFKTKKYVYTINGIFCLSWIINWTFQMTSHRFSMYYP